MSVSEPLAVVIARQMLGTDGCLQKGKVSSGIRLGRSNRHECRRKLDMDWWY